jgi:hypothetical protein
MMDLSLYDFSTATAAMELKDPRDGKTICHDDGRPFTITLRSSDHRDVVKASHRLLDESIGARRQTATAIIERTAKLCAAATETWDIVLNGKCPECTVVSAQQLYLDYPWIREQVNAFAAERGNFVKAH